MFIEVAQMCGNLFPISFLFGFYCFFLGFRFSGFVKTSLQPATIPMDVNHHVEPIIHRILHHFFHAIKPKITDFSSSLISVLIPGYGEPNRVKTPVLDQLNISLRNLRVAPASLSLCQFQLRAIRCFHLVSNINTQLHFGSQLYRITFHARHIRSNGISVVTGVKHGAG